MVHEFRRYTNLVGETETQPTTKRNNYSKGRVFPLRVVLGLRLIQIAGARVRSSSIINKTCACFFSLCSVDAKMLLKRYTYSCFNLTSL